MFDFIKKRSKTYSFYRRQKTINEVNALEKYHSHSRLLANGYEVEVIDQYKNTYLMNEHGHIVKMLDQFHNKFIYKENWKNIGILKSFKIRVNKNVTSNFLSYIHIDPRFIKYQKDIETKDFYVYKTKRELQEEKEIEQATEIQAKALAKALKSLKD